MRLRLAMCALLLCGSAQAAMAADLPFLRGSTYDEAPAPARWDGVYFGAQFGTNIVGGNFDGATGGLASMLLNGQVSSVTASPLGSLDHAGGAQYGGFVGYNMQWDGAVLGFEANYTRLNTGLTATNTMTGTYVSADGVTTNPLNATGTATVRFSDYGSLKVRGGWAAGMFMPYMSVGFAVVNATLDRSVTATFTPPAIAPGYVFTTPFAPLTLNTSTNALAYGYSLGVGLDILLTNCFFIRAEYEYASFGDFQQVNMHLHNARVAAAYKF
jgi:opacity protein-like surface antigen